MENKKIIFYDGVCNMCNSFVNTIISLDKKNQLFFSPLNGKIAKKLLNEHSEKIKNIDSVIFYSHSKISVKSKAVIDIINSLGSFYKIISILNIIPSLLLDYIYDLVAKNRYSWFGKKSSCPMPDKKIVSQFIE
tara:strand:- start:225 stop:626 length:402 start_codon:yes stop_codon:yes gene_type:complete